MVPSAAPVIFVVSRNRDHVAALDRALPNSELYHIPDTDTLLREAHLRPPQVALLYTDTPGTSLAQVLGILRQRAELAGTQWLAVGSQGLGELLAAGADRLGTSNSLAIIGNNEATSAY